MTSTPRFRLAVPVLTGTAVLACALLTGCGGDAGAHAASGRAGGGSGAESFSSASPTPHRATSGSATPSPRCDQGGGWNCRQRQRFVATKKYMDRQDARNGYLSVVFTDRRTGRTWRYGPTDHPGWTASTIKLAMATDILRRQRAGQITLTDADRHDLATMLNFSDEKASDRLWQRYGGDAQLARFRQVFGMTGLRFVPGFTNGTYWGFVKCTTEDLSHLMNYVLTRTAPADRSYLVDAMRGVAPNQQWGVWAAGRDQRPGNKDGWSYETDSYGKHWVLNTVGFAGPDERYAVAVMFQVAPGASEAYGAHTVSNVVALLFGRPISADTVVPTPDG